MSIRKKFLFTSVTVVGFFVLLEVILALVGVRQWRMVDDPFVGFQPGAPLFVRQGDQWQTNPVKLAYFNSQSFPTAKSNNTYRVFCMGGSTTFGHPYDYRTSFSNWLQVRLQDAAPDRNWEVINCGGVSYASYRICLLMEELNKHQPDLYVVYTGHNEYLESRTYGEPPSGLTAWVVPAVSQTRLATVMAGLFRSDNKDSKPGIRSDKHKMPGEVDAILDQTVGPAGYKRDRKWRDDVVRHYRVSLERICDLARSSGAKILFVKPACNQRDYSPFKSEHGDLSPDEELKWKRLYRQGLAKEQAGAAIAAADLLNEAARVDPEYALGCWQAGRAAMSAQRPDAAREWFQRAVDEDVCPLRATSKIIRTLEEVTAKEQVPLIDFPALLAGRHDGNNSQIGLGDEDFLDHVHPTIDGHKLAAWKIYDQMAQWNIAPSQDLTAAIEKRISERVLESVDNRRHALALVQVIQVISWAGKVEEALKLAERAEEVCPGLSEVSCYRGRQLEHLGRDSEAMDYYKEAVERNVKDSLALQRAGYLSLKLKKYVDARAYLATAVLHMPVESPIQYRIQCHFGLAMAFYQLEQWNEAILEYQATLKLAPDHALAADYLRRAKQNQK